jgi:alkanesulfonate monooxygenase SsuD/methylene tetrahydromethanopterin reductase-like flavin-dependent oxidoreductase (luciferase family)
VSKGRAGWRPQISWKPHEAPHVGLREVPPIDRRANDDVTRGYINDLFDEAADAVEVVRRLWDSWEDDAIIRDVPTGRFVDRDKLHYIDFRGRFFNVKGPSIVPRPPQGQPIVAALAHSEVPFRFAAKSADVVFVTPADGDDVSRKVGDIRAAEQVVERTRERLLVFADLVVFLDESGVRAEERRARLDELDGHAYRSDAAFFVGTPDGLADQLVDWQRHGLDGFRLRPAVVAHDLDAIVDGVVPGLQKRGAFRTEYPPGSLRTRFGLPRPENRYVTA